MDRGVAPVNEVVAPATSGLPFRGPTARWRRVTWNRWCGCWWPQQRRASPQPGRAERGARGGTESRGDQLRAIRACGGSRRRAVVEGAHSTSQAAPRRHEVDPSVTNDSHDEWWTCVVIRMQHGCEMISIGKVEVPGYFKLLS
jgi:hypothetical protein